ncbi:GCN5-related N-acetyltransferase [[Leptolyngbya] sp. PCC 7376]|nr:GCN5-related N-acetyltransferase [[Leptolyngbya] sp. PCC 7376]
MTNIRVVQSKDVDLILNTGIDGLADIEQWLSKRKLAFFLTENIYIAYLAFVDIKEEPIGVIMGGLEEEGRVWVEMLSVSSDYRRRGVGTALMDQLINTAEIVSARGLMVDIDHDNYGALKFYKRFGFKRVGHMNQYYYDSSKALIYFYEL